MINGISSIAAVYLPDNDNYWLVNETFINYGGAEGFDRNGTPYPRSSAAIAMGMNLGCSSVLWASPGSVDMHYGEEGYTTRVSGLRFVNTTRRVMFTRSDIFWDLDGSLTGHADTHLTKFHPFNNWPECPRSRDMASNASFAWFDDVTICNPGVYMRKLVVPIAIFPTELVLFDLNVSQKDWADPDHWAGPGQSEVWHWADGPPVVAPDFNNYAFPLVTGHTYGFRFWFHDPACPNIQGCSA